MKKNFILFMLVTIMLPLSAQRRSDRKLIEIKKVITISPTQETALRKAYEAYQLMSDSIIYEVNNPQEAARLKYDSDKKWKETFMATLTESQRNEYIRVTTSPEVDAKAAANVEALKETENYTQTQLDSAHVQIFEYLMQEKIVYSRDKYDYRKQKENIAQLKKRRPARMRQAEAHEKVRVQRKHYEGRTDW